MEQQTEEKTPKPRRRKRRDIIIFEKEDIIGKKTVETKDLKRFGNTVKAGDNKIAIFACPSCGEADLSLFSNSSDFFHKASEHYPYCDGCIENLFMLAMNEYDDDDIKAISIVCEKLDIPFLYSVFNDVKNGTSPLSMPIAYIKKYNATKGISKLPENFRSSDAFLINGSIVDAKEIVGVLESRHDLIGEVKDKLIKEYEPKIIEDIKAKAEDTYGDEQYLQNKRDVIRICGYDPFFGETGDDAKKMYADLINMIDDNLDIPAHLLNIYVDITRRQNEVKKLGQTSSRLLSDEENIIDNMKQIKDISATITNLQTSIINTAKEYKISTGNTDNAKKQTLTAIMRKLQNYSGLYDDQVNVYDMKTAKAFQQIEQISTENILKNLSLDENDYSKMVSDQFTKIKKLERDLANEKQKNRRISKQMYMLNKRISLLKTGKDDSDYDVDFTEKGDTSE